MSGLSLLDVLLYSAANGAGGSTAADGPKRIEQVAQQLVDCTQHDYQELNKLDEFLTPDDSDSGQIELSAILRAMYDEWSRQAEAVLDKVSIITGTGVVLQRIEELRDAHGRTRAMLSVSLNDIAEARRQAREGRTYKLEEVRRELRTRTHR